MALGDRELARRATDKITHAWYYKDEPEAWTDKHSFLANMNGMAIRFGLSTPDLEVYKNMRDSEVFNVDVQDGPIFERNWESSVKELDECCQEILMEMQMPCENFVEKMRLAYGDVEWCVDEENRRAVRIVLSAPHRWILKTGDYWGEQETNPWYFISSLLALGGDTWYANARQIHYMRKVGIIDQLPPITEDMIDEKGEGDYITKSLALGQCFWLGLQLIARRWNNLPSTQLEIGTSAFAGCSLLTYLVFWQKPQGVELPFICNASRRPSIDEIIEIACLGGRRATGDYLMFSAASNSFFVYDWKEWFISGSLICSTLFGVIHCAAWNYHFPTQIDCLLWRISVVATIALPWVHWGNLWLSFNWKTFGRLRKYIPIRKGVGVDNLIVVYIYSVFRLIIMAEMIRTLFYLPPEAFIATPLVNLPHLE